MTKPNAVEDHDFREGNAKPVPEPVDWMDEPVTIHFKEDGIPGLRRGELTKEAKKQIQVRMLEERMQELKKLTDHQINSQDLERANPGFSLEVVEASKVYEQIEQLTKESEALK